MKKLLNGIAEFHKNRTDDSVARFAELALGQSPDCLFIACSDSRVAANVFASTDPGDLFVVRNVGNMVACCGKSPGVSRGDLAEPAALEFALRNLDVKDIIVCGHSSCGAMQALHGGIEKLDHPNLKQWLENGSDSLERFKTGKYTGDLPEPDILSQVNVRVQLEHLQSYPDVSKRVKEGSLKLHGMWFNIGKAEVSLLNTETDQFEVIR